MRAARFKCHALAQSIRVKPRMCSAAAEEHTSSAHPAYDSVPKWDSCRHCSWCRQRGEEHSPVNDQDATKGSATNEPMTDAGRGGNTDAIGQLLREHGCSCMGSQSIDRRGSLCVQDLPDHLVFGVPRLPRHSAAAWQSLVSATSFKTTRDHPC